MSTILIIGGSWHLPIHYKKLIERLEGLGHRVICEPNPSNITELPTTKNIDDDVAFYKDLAAAEVAKGTRLTVLAHSWGGQIATASLSGFAPTSPNSGGITNIIFLAAFMPTEETWAITAATRGVFTPNIIVKDNNTLDWTDPIHCLYSDVPEDEAREAERLRSYFPVDAHVTDMRLDRVAWRDAPSSYILCENDQAVALNFQDAILNGAKEAGGEFKEYRLQSGHSPFISKVDDLVDIVTECVKAHP